MLLTPSSFVPSYKSGVEPPANALWFIGHQGQLLVSDSSPPALPAGDTARTLVLQSRLQFFGCWNKQECIAAELETATQAPAGYRWVGLRSLFLVLPDELLALAGRGLQILEWDRSHRFCGRCASPTTQKDNERVKLCPRCGYAAYPRIAPVMMVLIHRGRQILLARAPHYAPQMYSALAGFVESGESVEETVRREVREEVNLEVDNLRYFGSQTWPFPHQLMIAFHADYAGGELKPDPAEIADAAWFDVDRLPALPSTVSIARQLIEAAVASIGGRRS